MSHKYELITFDVYSALFDIEASLLPVLRTFLRDAVDVPAFFRTWRAKQLEYTLIHNSLGGAYVTFRAITAMALEYTLGRFKRSLPTAERKELVNAWDRLVPWPEADHVLSVLKERGYRTGLLSNGDKAMLEALAEVFGAKIDYIFSCEETGRYKPHSDIYKLPLNLLGLSSDRMVHTATGPTDVLGAKAAGIPCAWANRTGDLVLDQTYHPDWEFPDLTGLLRIL